MNLKEYCRLFILLLMSLNLSSTWEKAYDKYFQNGYDQGHEIFFTTKDLEKILNKLVIIGKWITTYKNSIAELRLEEIMRLASSSKHTFLASKYIRRRQKALRFILKRIAKGNNLHDLSSFRKLLNLYNQVCGPKIEMNSDGDFYNDTISLEEEGFYPSKGTRRLFSTIDETNAYRIAIIFCNG